MLTTTLPAFTTPCMKQQFWPDCSPAATLFHEQHYWGNKFQSPPEGEQAHYECLGNLWTGGQEVLDAVDICSHEALDAAAGTRARTEVILQVPICSFPTHAECGHCRTLRCTENRAGHPNMHSSSYIACMAFWAKSSKGRGAGRWCEAERERNRQRY